MGSLLAQSLDSSGQWSGVFHTLLAPLVLIGVSRIRELPSPVSRDRGLGPSWARD